MSVNQKFFDILGNKNLKIGLVKTMDHTSLITAFQQKKDATLWLRPYILMIFSTSVFLHQALQGLSVE